MGSHRRVPGAQGLQQTGVLYLKSKLSKPPTSWKDFYELVKDKDNQQGPVAVQFQGDVFVFPLKMLGYSSNSVDKKPTRRAGILLEVAPHILRARLQRFQLSMKDGTTVMTLGSTGPLGQELKDEHDAGEALYYR